MAAWRGERDRRGGPGAAGRHGCGGAGERTQGAGRSLSTQNTYRRLSILFIKISAWSATRVRPRGSDEFAPARLAQDLWSVAALDAGNELVFPSNPQARCENGASGLGRTRRRAFVRSGCCIATLRRPDGVPRANSPSSKSDDEKTSGAETTHWAGDSREDSWQNTSPALSQKEGDVAPAGGQGAPANSSYLARPLARPGGPVQAPAGPRWDAPAEDEQDAVRRERARLSARRMRANHQVSGAQLDPLCRPPCRTRWGATTCRWHSPSAGRRP